MSSKVVRCDRRTHSTPEPFSSELSVDILKSTFNERRKSFHQPLPSNMNNPPARLLYIILYSLYITHNASARSSLVHLHQPNHKLTGHVIDTLICGSTMQCAHRCLAEPICGGYNFKELGPSDKQGTCELVGSLTLKKDEFTLIEVDGWTCGRMTSQDKTFTFTNLGANGREGPVSTDQYMGTSLEGKVKLVSGIQQWIVPQTGSYVIDVLGASGGNGTNATLPRKWRKGGLGARIKGVLFLNRGQTLKILVGQEGQTVMMMTPNPGSGGGGSFVTLLNNKPLIVAGGGGGGSSPADYWLDGDHGQTTMNGSISGGSDGSGGGFSMSYGLSLGCGAGGGFNTDGRSNSFITTGGTSFMNGGLGGYNQPSVLGNGGFGGGGSCRSDPGGGGGYSGGGVEKNDTYLQAGGGGSYNIGTDQENHAGVNKGHGRVTVSILT